MMYLLRSLLCNAVKLAANWAGYPRPLCAIGFPSFTLSMARQS